MLCLTLGGAMFMHKVAGGGLLALLGFSGVLYIMFKWWRDVISEGIRDHAHTGAVSHGLRFGMGLFILSEVMFFVAFFWAFFNASILPKVEVTEVWQVSNRLMRGICPSSTHSFCCFRALL
jgi:cytochrome c oxidase subunit 3